MDSVSPAEALWHPPASAFAESNLARYQRWVSERYRVQCGDYRELYDWSVTQIGPFWESIAEYFGVQCHRQPQSSIEHHAQRRTRRHAGQPAGELRVIGQCGADPYQDGIVHGPHHCTPAGPRGQPDGRATGPSGTAGRIFSRRVSPSPAICRVILREDRFPEGWKAFGGPRRPSATHGRSVEGTRPEMGRLRPTRHPAWRSGVRAEERPHGRRSKE